MLNKWESDKTNTMISAAILLVNLVIDMRGIIYIGDKMNKESNDRERR